MPALATPALAAGTPNGTADSPTACAPYWPITAQDGGFICSPALAPGVRVSNASFRTCIDNGLGYRNTPGTAYGVCSDPGLAIAGDSVSRAENETQRGIGTSVCAARGLGSVVDTQSTVMTCTGAVASPVQDAGTRNRLDSVNDHLQALEDASAAGSGGAATGDGQTGKNLVALVWVIVVVGGLVAAILLVLITVHVIGRLAS